MATVHDVAAYLTGKFGALGTLKLEKLVYYCQAWWVARNDSLLFPEQLQAWKLGPVCPTLYSCHRQQNFVDEWPWGNAANLTETERSHIDAVTDVYSVYSGFRLVDMTHEEAPWLDAIANGLNTPITVEAMRQYFQQIDQRSK